MKLVILFFLKMETLTENLFSSLLHHFDPLSLLLFGMTCRANVQRRKIVVAKRARCWHHSNYIYTLMDRHGTTALLEWAETQWKRDPWANDTRNALSMRNFKVAEWLLEKRKFKRYGFDELVEARDYEGMTWCYEHGFKLWKTDAKPEDLVYSAWFKGKKISKMESEYTFEEQVQRAGGIMRKYPQPEDLWQYYEKDGGPSFMEETV